MLSIKQSIWKPLLSGILVFLVIIAPFELMSNINPGNHEFNTPQTKQTTSTHEETSTDTGEAANTGFSLVNNNGLLSFGNWNSLKLLLEKYASIMHPKTLPSSPTYGIYPEYYYNFLLKEATPAVGDALTTTATTTATTVPVQAVTTVQESNSEPAGSYSKTNVQVPGIDEADIVKTNGEYISFITRNGTLVLYHAYPPSELKKKAVIDIIYLVKNYNPGGNLTLAVIQGNKTVSVIGKIQLLNINPTGLYITNKSVFVLVTAVYGVAQTYTYPGGWSTVIFSMPVKTVTWVLQFNLDGKIERTFWVTGRYVSSRYVTSTGNLVLVTQQPAYSPVGGSPVKPDTVYGSIDPKHIYLLGQPVDYTILTWLDTNTWKPVNAALLGDRAGSMYMPAPNTLFVTTRSYHDIIKILYNVGFEVESKKGGFYITLTPTTTMTTTNENKNTTPLSISITETISPKGNFTLVKAELVNNEVKVVASTSIPGMVGKQWQMDLYNGTLRIVTYNPATTSVSLVILNSTTLAKISELDNITVNERIHGVRFIGDKLYLVTYRRVDPLFYIDLSNPEKPSIVGYLKAPGFDEYIHPLNETFILGIGRGEAWSTLRISTYKILDNGTIKVISRLRINYTDSPVLRPEGHRAFVYYPEKHLAIIPVQSMYWKNIYIGVALVKVNTTSGKLGLVKILEPINGTAKSIPQNQYNMLYTAMNRVRGLYTDNIIYVVNTEVHPYVVAYNLTTLTLISQS
ncbi:MAG: beta-propeller domain-containing protein [Desulfurococcales archaeon]|nr:beta-propeller domain-containing protein [Desulfurococcales archaeon]